VLGNEQTSGGPAVKAVEATRQGVAAGQLPRTGADVTRLVRLAGGALAAGGAVVANERRLQARDTTD
jgi:LPXTG-motif cell wall-anchored protein